MVESQLEAAVSTLNQNNVEVKEIRSKFGSQDGRIQELEGRVKDAPVDRCDVTERQELSDLLPRLCRSDSLGRQVVDRRDRGRNALPDRHRFQLNQPGASRGTTS